MSSARFLAGTFDKFKKPIELLGTQMKATGEVMAIGRTAEEAMQKAVRITLKLMKRIFILKKLIEQAMIS